MQGLIPFRVMLYAMRNFFSFADLGVAKQKTGFSFVLFLFAVEKKSFSLCPLLEKKVDLLCLGVASKALMLFESV